MSETMDPPRMFEADGVPAELQALLEEAHGDVLGAEAVSRVSAGVQAQLGGSGTPTDGSASPPTGDGSASGTPGGESVVPSSTAGKVGAGVVVAALIGGGLWLAGDHGAETSGVASSQSTTIASTAAPETPAGDPALGGSPTPTENTKTAPAPTESAPRATTPPVATKPAATATAKTSSKPSQADLVAEHQLLRSARAALSSNPKRAYALTQEHRRRFPSGMLVQEREVIAIEALARMGNDKAASDRADQFSKDYPDSPHKDRVDGATGGK